jgi:hypothetical protein
MRNTDAIKERFARIHAAQEQVVLDALKKCGGKYAGTVMKFRHFLAEPLGENAIKRSLKRLAEKCVIRISGEDNSGKGKTYTVQQ